MRLPVLAALLCLIPAPLLALEVGEVRWGFDGTVALGAFNLASIALHNDQPEPYEGVLVLARETYGGRRGGGRHVAPLYLPPNGRRVVQFSVLVLARSEDWVLRDGAGRVVTRLPETATARAPVVVELRGDRPTANALTGGRDFPAAWFPTAVGATHALELAVLDHDPDWSEPQRQALADWVARGGQLHLLGTAEELPRLSGALAPLAPPADRLAVGAGWVFRHPQRSAPLAASALATLANEPVGPATLDPGNLLDLELEQPQPVQLFKMLERLVYAGHDWRLLLGLATLYWVLIGPGGAWLGWRAKRHWLVPTGVSLALVAGFSALFHAIGQRGYGETTSVHVVALAHEVAPGRQELLAFGNLFVTGSDAYRIAFDAPHPLFDAGMDAEPVDATCTTGGDGAFHAVVPLFSSRGFVFNGVVAGSAPRGEWVPSDPASGPDAVTVTVTQPPLAAYMRRGEQVYRFSSASSGHLYAPTLVTSGEMSNWLGTYGHYGLHRKRDQAQVDDRTLIALGEALIAYAVHHTPPTPLDAADLYLIASAPSWCLPLGSEGGGAVVYVQRLRRPTR